MSKLDAVKEVRLQERHYIGMAITMAFAAYDPKRMEGLQKLFISRRFEIKGMLDAGRYVCLTFVCEQLFTYLFCMEVTGLDAVPNDMIGFSIPEQRYATIRAKASDPYDLIHAYIKANGLQLNKHGMSLEVYVMHPQQQPDECDVFVPLL